MYRKITLSSILCHLKMWKLSKCNWPDNYPARAQPPQPTPTTTKWQAHLCTEIPISVLQQRRLTIHLCRATTCQAQYTSSAHLSCFQHGKDMCIADMIMIGFFFLCYPGEHTVTFDNKPFKLLNVQFNQDNKHVPIQSSKLYPWWTFQPLPMIHRKTVLKASVLAMDILSL